ncbi:nitrogen regulation protein NR(I) [Wenzhouxiangella sp. AB-CW3]|uniref:nitrogen regulation protein NR(I) n=1 Tax=Wenzhouxiangella sp. AB-CW3 TaxID=2771012 RepID=UPI00168B6D88|nr:nitrogen regulation protein NR(I) [Wenzhouxiangella sp. AB-CW3]QOC22278.1 nitrogen regulation protein NR(I) [Wenzhouxiangella sp. AB-CW3]
MNDAVWIIDDDPGIRYVLSEFFEERKTPARCFSRGKELLAALDHEQPGLVMADIRLDGEDGLELMHEARARHTDLPVIVMTAYSDLDSAVRAFRGGAFEFLAKPFDLEEVGRLVDKALQTGPDEAESSARKAGMIGSSPSFQQVIRLIGRLSASEVPVLITGETGTGKELVARALHNHSPCSSGPFIAINTAAIPADLLESELFGYERGAFTGAEQRRAGHFERASGGTLFLDEIGDMPLTLQSRLLRVLAEGEYYRLGGRGLVQANVRVIAATHHELGARVESGEFRADLYHRLKVISLKVPPLKERREDIPELIDHFLGQAAEEFHLPTRTATPELVDYLKQLDWPGNVRELKHLCQSMAALAPATLIGLDDLPPEYRDNQSTSTNGEGWESDLARETRRRTASATGELHEELQARFEASLSKAALEACNGNKSEAARRLGISRNTLARMIGGVKGER